MGSSGFRKDDVREANPVDLTALCTADRDEPAAFVPIEIHFPHGKRLPGDEGVLRRSAVLGERLAEGPETLVPVSIHEGLIDEVVDIGFPLLSCQRTSHRS